jgi:hypothetical protein
MHALLIVAALLSAQSKDDKRESLKGLTQIAFKETLTGSANYGGGSAGSPYLLQATGAMKAAGIKPMEVETAVQKGVPIYELLCTSMGENQLTIACESRFIRPVHLEANPDSPRTVYAATWSSSMIVGSFAYDRVSDLDKLTVKLVEQFVADWQAANPSANAAPKKKK